MYVMLIHLETLYLGCQTVRGSSITPGRGHHTFIFPTITLNHSITLNPGFFFNDCSNLRIIVFNAMRVFYDFSKLCELSTATMYYQTNQSIAQLCHLLTIKWAP